MRELVRYYGYAGRAAAVAVLLGAAGCGADADGATAVVLARADGWREGAYEAAGRPYVLIEIAADRARAEQAWNENVTATLPPADGDPGEPGVYGMLDDVDFERRAVVVYSSGTSGTCPAWVRGIETTNGRVEITLGSSAERACTDDYRPYRLVLAVERDALPGLSELPVERIDVPSENLTGVEGRVVAYPAGPRGETDAADSTSCLAASDPFDRDEARERARSLLGLREDQIPESRTVRIARRGDDHPALRMDLRPGRCNVELDADGANRFRVTRVEVEVPAGEDALVVE